MRPADSDSSATRAQVAERYRHFAEVEAAESSPPYAAWAAAVAGDDAVLDRLVALGSRREQQPNLLFAAARWCGAEPGDVPALLGLLQREWPRVTEVMRSRRTQTNEVGRCAVLLPLLATLPQPLALIEVGASAGLCLLPDRYSYRWRGADGGEHALDPVDGPSEVTLRSRVDGPVELPTSMPDVVWRAGLDLNPLDVHDDDAMAWLQTLVWPGPDDRPARLAAAVDVARHDPPRVVRADLNEGLADLAAQAPARATLVVFHSAVLAYLDEGDRARFVDRVRALPGHWISNEGRGLVESDPPPDLGLPHADELFTVALDGRAVGLAHGHGSSATWLAGER